MEAKDFIEGKRSNYYVVNSELSNYGNLPITYSKRNVFKKPYVSYHSRELKSQNYFKRPDTISSNHGRARTGESNDLWKLKHFTERFNEGKPKKSKSFTEKYRNEEEKEFKGKKIMETIVNGLKTMNEEDLNGMFNYMNYLKEQRKALGLKRVLNKNEKKIPRASSSEVSKPEGVNA